MPLPTSGAPGDYGLPKADYNYVLDPTTEFSASELTRAMLDIAAASRTVPRAWVYCTVSGSTVTVVDHDAVWGGTVGVKPTTTYNSTGNITITWPTTVTDLNPTVASRLTYTVSLRTASVNINSTSVPLACQLSVSGHTATLVTVNSSTVAGADPLGFTLFVW